MIRPACGWLNLSALVIYFETTGLVKTATGADELSDYNNQTVVRRDGWALGDVEVDEMLILGQPALVLLQNLAHMLKVKCMNLEWKAIGETKNFRRIGLMHKAGLAWLECPITTLHSRTYVDSVGVCRADVVL